MKKLNLFLLFCITFTAFGSFSSTKVWAQNKYILYVTYKLPTNPDSDASNLESECTNKYAVCMQTCQIRDGKIDCQNRCELAFRQCLLSINHVKFWLAACKEGSCKTVEDIIPLTRDEALDIRLNDKFNEIKPGYYSMTGTYVTVSPGSYTFRRTSDNAEISFHGSDFIGQAISNYNSNYGSSIKKDALCASIENGQGALMQSLLSRGVEVNGFGNPYGFYNPIDIAQKMERWDIIKELVTKYNADVNNSGGGSIVGTGLTVLQGAVKKNDMDMVKLLVDHGAKIDGTGFWQGVGSPLGIAIGLGINNISMVEFLISQGADVNGIGNFAGGESYLATAVTRGNLPVIRILLQNGADIHKKDYSGKTPLAIAIKNKNISIVKVLVSGSPAGINDFDYAGLAVIYDDIEILKYLISQGADVNNRKAISSDYAMDGTYSQLPLAIAAWKGNLSIIKILLQHGTNINEKLFLKGETALDYAEENNQKEIATFLRSKGAKNGQ